MHHAAEADSSNPHKRGIVLLRYLVLEISIALLQALPNICEAVCPDAVFIAVFPIVASRGDWRVVLADQYRLDARRAKLDA